MSPTRREKQHATTREEIKQIAWEQMRLQGTAAISLRGIAREMGLTAPAIYRYFPSRDDIITALLMDAYTQFGDAMEASARQPAASIYEQIVLIGLAYREWAVQNRVQYELIFGNPIPEYEAPAEETIPLARRAFIPLIGAILEAMQMSDWQPKAHVPTLTPRLIQAMQPRWAAEGVPLEAVYLATRFWTRVHGMVTLELYDHTPPLIGDAAEFYRLEIISLLEE